MAGLPNVGAVAGTRGVEYRVWAPGHRRVAVVIGHDAAHARVLELAAVPDGHFQGLDPDGRAGDWYGFRIDDASDRVPDPASRYQPLGVDGPSEVVDALAYHWRDGAWKRPPWRGRVIYELHVGTFTREGTFRAAAARLPGLAELGVNTVELMPLADFPGRWNWGYDGVFPYAPARCYGRPEDLRELVDAAHELDLAVVIDVVYNHLGPVGNPLRHYSDRYHHSENESPWGRSFNFDGRDSRPVRDFFVGNAVYWLDEFHADGLRLDATHAVHDASPEHLFAEIAREARQRGAFTIAEDERNEAAVISTAGNRAWGVDAAWADDFHHSARVALTGDRHSYFAGYRGDAAELASTLRQGWLYQGDVFPTTQQPRGTPAGHLPPERFVYCLSNHDQTGNRALGERLAMLIPPAAYRAASLLLCLVPGTPMIFQGDEWGAGTPFLFFSDHPGEIGAKMLFYRKQEFAGQGPAVLAQMPDPQAEETFRRSQLDWDEPGRGPHRGIRELYRRALALRAANPHFQNPDRATWSAVAEGDVLLLRWRTGKADWLLTVQLKVGAGRPLLDPAAAPTPGRRWEPVLSSEDPDFGGAAPPAAVAEVLASAGPSAVLYRER